MSLTLDELTKGEITTNTGVESMYKMQYYPDMILYTFDPNYQIILGNSRTPSSPAGLYVRSNQVGVRTSPTGHFAFEVGPGNMKCASDAVFSGRVAIGPVDFEVDGDERLIVSGNTIIRGNLTLSSGMLLSGSGTSSNSTVLSSPDGEPVVTFHSLSHDATFEGGVYTKKRVQVMRPSSGDPIPFDVDTDTMVCNVEASFPANVVRVGPDTPTYPPAGADPPTPSDALLLTGGRGLYSTGSIRLASGMRLGDSSGNGVASTMTSPEGVPVVSFGHDGVCEFQDTVIAKRKVRVAGMVPGAPAPFDVDTNTMVCNVEASFPANVVRVGPSVSSGTDQPLPEDALQLTGGKGLYASGSIRTASGMRLGASPEDGPAAAVMTSPQGSTVASFGHDGTCTFQGDVHGRAFYVLSDGRAKTDLTDACTASLKACTGLIRDLGVKHFRYKGCDQQRIGLVAQDLSRLISDSYPKCPFKNSIVLENGPAGRKVVDAGQLLMVAICSIQDCIARLDAMECRC